MALLRWYTPSALHRALGCALVGLSLGCTSEGTGIGMDSLAVTLPRDELPHEVPLEWWYYTGHLRNAAGQRFGFELTFFKREVGAGAILANFALTDVSGQRFHFAEKAWLADVAYDGFVVEVGGWSVSGEQGRHELEAEAPGHALRLSLTPTKPAVLHGGNGVIGNDEEGRTFYYSNTRLAAEGVVRSGDTEYEVTGQAWMDHQWFDRDVPRESLAWDWYALQLDDDTELMLTVLRWSEEDVWFGTLADADAHGTQLGNDDIVVEARSSWTNPVSGNTYPMGWAVRLPGHGLDLTVEPLLLDQELHGLQYTPIDYWEGVVDLSGTHDGKPVVGRGYVELVGSR